MLRVGLTGGMGSGKSTAGAMLRQLGATLLSSDAIGRELMEPGQPMYLEIVDAMGASVLAPDGSLRRDELARLAFEQGRAEELNEIVHPAVIARQEQMVAAIAAEDPGAIVVVESALRFETRYGGPRGWRQRFDRVILVTAPEELKVRRTIARKLGGRLPLKGEQERLRAEALARLARQLSDESKTASVDYVLSNGRSRSELQRQVEELWPLLVAQRNRTAGGPPASTR